jgi:hypothetical protein
MRLKLTEQLEMTKALVAGAVAAAVLMGGPTLATAVDDPIDQARKAAEATPFSGRVTITWNDNGIERQDQLDVESAGGVLSVQGRRSVMALAQQRLVHGDAGWQVLWPSGLGLVGHPGLATGYAVQSVPGPVVAGYPTRVAEVRKEGVLRELLFFEERTGLLVRRDQYGRNGDLERRVEFQTLAIADSAAAPPAAPRGARSLSLRPTSASTLPSSFEAPGRLAQGYRRLGLYLRGGVLQALYSDGVYELSLFEQRGRLDRGQLPAHARSMPVGGSRGWNFAWPGGQVLIWHAGSSVYTLVGDAPPEDLVAVGRSVPSHAPASLAHKLRQACRGLVEAFRGDF